MKRLKTIISEQLQRGSITNYLNSKKEKPNEKIDNPKTVIDTQQSDTTNITL